MFLKLFSIFVFAVFSLMAAGCDKFNPSPAAPTQVISETPDGSTDGGPIVDPASAEVIRNWSPYVLVHNTCEAPEVYRDAMLRLQSRGRLRGVRSQIDPIGTGRCINDMSDRMGLEVLGLIINEDLLAPNLEDTLRQTYNAHPYVQYVQIGNEVTLAMVNRQTMTNEQYLEIFRRAYRFTVENYPDKTVVTQAFWTGGAADLEKLIKAGIFQGVDANRLVIAMNIYNRMDAAKFGNVVRGLPYRKWVTESGARDWNKHVSYVKEVYPAIRAQVGAERIYWYALWTGDSGPDFPFGLINNALTGNYSGSPLFNILTK